VPAGCAAPSLLADESGLNWTGAEPVTAPAIADGKAFVACPDRHRVVALDSATGKPGWSVTLGGRMDVPPTVHQGLCLVGCRDGWVYALRTSDGALAWRYRVAPREGQIVAFGQLESPWPVVGGVLLRDGLAYALAGRTSESDGGVVACCLDPRKGTLLWETRPSSDPAKGFHGLADMLVADDKCVSGGGNAHLRLDPKSGHLLGRAGVDALRAGSQNGQYFGYIPSSSALLDRSWHFSRNWKVDSRFNTQWKGGLTGQIVAFDKDLVVASRSKSSDKICTSVIVAQKPAATERAVDAPLWSVELADGQRAEALVLVGGRVLVGTASLDRKQGKLLVLAAKDGVRLAEHDLPGAVASEGMAVAGGSVYVSTWTGEVLCFSPAQ
jgi:outer membrane protein assembly factor BamB